MKVIGFTGNYGTARADGLQCYLMADSSILYTGRPFFVPDFAERFVASPSIVVRTGRLGKCVAPKFAYRYWDALTAGFNVLAQGDEEPVAAALDRAFDGAAILGEWVSVTTLDDALTTPVEIRVDDTVVSRHCLADLAFPLDDELALLSRRCSIKMGDVIFTGDTAAGIPLSPGMHLTATVGGIPVLDVKVRL